MNNKILIVEDDKFITDILQESLELFDYDVTVINHIDEIAEFSNFNKYKVILLDIMMKTEGQLNLGKFSESGEAAYELIRKDSPNTKVIVMTALERDDIDIDFSNENTLYMKKPFSELEQILDAIDQ